MVVKRDLFYSEREAIKQQLELFEKTPGLLNDFLSPVFNPKLEPLFGEERKEYNKVFYEAPEGKICFRKYWVQENMLGFSIHEIMKVTELSTYEQYLGAFKRQVDALRLARTILVMSYSSLEYTETQKVVFSEGFENHVEKMKTWFAVSFLLTPFLGRKKEAVAKAYLKNEAEKYEGLKVMKTSTQKDILYRIDFVVLDASNEPVLGVSVKGLSHLQGEENSYFLRGEKTEKQGHKLFEEKYKAPVTVIHSGLKNEDKIVFIGEIREALQNLKVKGKIFRKGSSYDNAF